MLEIPFFYLCGLPEILLKFPRSQCFLQMDHRHWKKYSKGTVALAVIVGEMQSGLLPEKIQLVVVFSSQYKGKGFVAIHVTQDS